MQHLDFKLLRSFAAVADERSVTRAAERLNLTQPTVSGQLKELEKTLGYLLFHRTSRRIALTDQGQKLYPLVRTLLEQAEDVRLEAEALQDASRSHFRLGAAMYTLDFADRTALLTAFVSARPDISYTIDNRLQSDQVRDLLTERLDAALLLGIASDQPTTKFIRDLPPGCIVNEVQYPAALERVVLRRRKIGLLVPEGSELADYAVIPRTELAGRRIAMLSGEHGDDFINPLVAFLLAQGAMPIVPPEGNTLAVERYAVREHCCAIGIGWFPTPKGMVWREVEHMNMHLDFAVVLGTSANRAAQRFFDFASSWQARRKEPAHAAAEGGPNIGERDGSQRL